MFRSETSFPSVDGHTATHFGTLLKTLRHRHGIRQLQVLAHLPGWTQTTYSRVENGELAPAFAQLAPIYCALHLAGVELTPRDRQQFLSLARARIEAKKTYRERKTDQEWDEVRLILSRTEPEAPNHEQPAPRQERGASKPRLVETRHLVGREDWFASVITSLHETLPKKLVVLQGPVGIGKSSELHRIALHVLHADAPRPQVVLCELPIVEQESGPQSALDLFLSTLLVEIGPPDASLHMTSLDVRITFALECLEKAARPFLLLLDNAEQVLDEQGQVSSCWEQFLGRFLRCPHQATLVLATTEWPGWFEGERVFLAERMIPPLSADAGAMLLQRLGLAAVAVEHLRRVSERVGGIPLCLEWVASLAQEPMWLDTWDEIDGLDGHEEENGEEEALTRRLLRLVEDSALFGGPIASKLKPLLERIIEKRLSAEAYQVLCTLALTAIPLGKPALQLVCPRPRLLKELSSASLLVAYPHRAQLLPMVASAMRSRLSIEQRHLLEERLMDAYLRSLNEGKASDHEVGAIIAELAVLYLNHHRLLDAAELLLYHGWLSFRQGYAQRLARLIQTVLDAFDWQAAAQTECGGLLLQCYFLPYIGFHVSDQEQTAVHRRILDYVLAKQVTVEPLMEVYLVHVLMRYYMSEDQFEQAQMLLNDCFCRMESALTKDFELHVMLLSKRAWLFGKWSGYDEARGCLDEARDRLGHTIETYQHCISLLEDGEQEASISPLRKSTLKKKCAVFLNNLSYHLNRMGRFEEALQAVEQSIDLRERGYEDFGTIAAAYGEKSQILAALGRFRDAQHFDEKARTEVRRCANTGDTFSQEEVWVYQVNQGRLYLRLGRIDVAEQLLRDAEFHIAARRKIYRLFAKEALMEIEQIQRSPHPQQLDWRWVERYRELDAYDAYWWWAPAGPFSTEEQHQWDQLFSPSLHEASKSQLATVLTRSRNREVEAALAEHREPHLLYPAIDIEEVRRRIAGFLQLDAEIARDEPNAIVRRLYHGTIEDELSFIRAIEATYEGNSERFWKLNRQLNPPPTLEEMHFALSRTKQVIVQGLQRTDTLAVSQHVIHVWRDQLHLPFDLTQDEELLEPQPHHERAMSTPNQPMISTQAAQRFFEAALEEGGFDGWTVVLDPGASGARVDSALRQIFLQEGSVSLDIVRDTFIHEILGHVSRSAAGACSLLGLLGLNTKGYAPTEEGLAQHYERTLALERREMFDDSGSWLGGLAVGLASGVVTPPQTFSDLYAFFEPLILLHRLLWRYDEDRPTAEERAHTRALMRCVRTFRGVPDLEGAGVCYTRDVVYLRGRLKIEQAVAEDETVLDRLAVGKVALELLPDLQELGITTPSQSLRKRAYDPDLDAYIFSFERSGTSS